MGASASKRAAGAGAAAPHPATVVHGAPVSYIPLRNTMKRLRRVLTTFDKKEIAASFRSFAEPSKSGFAHRRSRPASTAAAAAAASGAGGVAAFAEPTDGSRRGLPETFAYGGKEFNTAEWLEHQQCATGLVVLQVESATRATLAYEQYGHGNTQESKCISWSTGKSVVSALFGIAMEEGLIGDIENTTVGGVLPECRGTAYEHVPLKAVLEMSSGVKFDEDYGAFFSDINKFGRLMALGHGVNKFARSLSQEAEPGTVNHYVSMDTQILGCIVEKVTGMPLTQYLEERLWSKIGAEDEVCWLVDNQKDGMEMAFGTLNWRTRDAARFGWLYCNGGVSPADGTTQVVPAEWVRRSTTAGSPHTQPGPSNTHRHQSAIDAGYDFGYGYQWWVPGKQGQRDEVAGDYLAIGIYGQFIYVNPEHGVVVAMNSAFADYDKGANDVDSEMQAVALFRATAAHYSVAAAGHHHGGGGDDDGGGVGSSSGGSSSGGGGGGGGGSASGSELRATDGLGPRIVHLTSV